MTRSKLGDIVGENGSTLVGVEVEEGGVVLAGIYAAGAYAGAWSVPTCVISAQQARALAALLVVAADQVDRDARKEARAKRAHGGA